MSLKRRDDRGAMVRVSGLPPVKMDKLAIDYFQKPARLVILESYRKWRLRKYGEYIEEAQSLGDKLVEFGRTLDRLANLDRELEVDRINREANVLEAHKRLRELQKEENEADIQEDISRKELLYKQKQIERKLAGRDEEEEAKRRVEKARIGIKTGREISKMKMEDVYSRRSDIKDFRKKWRSLIEDSEELSEREKENELEDLEDYIKYSLDRS